MSSHSERAQFSRIHARFEGPVFVIPNGSTYNVPGLPESSMDNGVQRSHIRSRQRRACLAAAMEAHPMIDNAIEVVFSFDTTGSMYPCLTQVRKKIKSTVTRLMKEIPGMRIGIIAHGDYCDAGSTYVTKALDLTDDVREDLPLRRARRAHRRRRRAGVLRAGPARGAGALVDGRVHKCFVLIGDDVPHGPAQNPKRLNWREEVDKLGEKGSPSTASRRSAAGTRRPSTASSPEDRAASPRSRPVRVHHRYGARHLLQAVVGREARGVREGDRRAGAARPEPEHLFNTMMKREKPAPTFAAADLHAVPPGRFQVLAVDADYADQGSSSENGLRFKKGRGFYEFTKTETIQAGKEVVLMDRRRATCSAARRPASCSACPRAIRAAPADEPREVRGLRPEHLGEHRLMGGTRFLYEVEDWSKAEAA